MCYQRQSKAFCWLQAHFICKSLHVKETNIFYTFAEITKAQGDFLELLQIAVIIMFCVFFECLAVAC